MLEGADIRILTLGLATACLAGCGSSAKVTKLGPTNHPLAVVEVSSPPLPDGGTTQIGLRLVTSLSLQGGAPIEARVDTGSSGVQLLANLLSTTTLNSLSRTQTQITETFPESGIQATGYLASATVAFGEAATPSPILVAVFDQLSCVAGTICPADAGSLEPYVFNGSPCLLGLGMRTSGGLGNPIVQLPGQPSYIVEAPAFGGDAGTLRIAPSDAEVAAYQVFQLPDGGADALQNGAPAWDDLALPACVDDETAGTQFCGNALLDTGTPVVEVAWQGTQIIEVSPGTDMSVSIGPTASPLAQFNVTIGSPPQYGLDAFFLAPAAPNFGQLLLLGLPVFSRYNVLFDQAHGQVGLLAH